MDEATQREIAASLVKELSREGLDAVLVGSSAVVALEIFPRSSKETFGTKFRESLDPSVG